MSTSVAVSSCKVCNAQTTSRLVHGGHAIHRCASCDLEFVHPTPSDAEIAAVYENGYFSDETAFGYRDYFQREHHIQTEKAHARLGLLREECQLREGAKVLDVGCASGVYLEFAERQGFQAYGVELAAEARARAAHNVRDRIFATLDGVRASGPFDCITFWDVIEHLPDPFASIDEVVSLLAPGGMLGVVVPIIDNINARVAPRTWDQYKPPEHLWYFSRQSLRATLEQRVGPVIVERSAWRRTSRFASTYNFPGGGARKVVRRAEEILWGGLSRLHLVPSRWLEDSILMVARRARQH